MIDDALRYAFLMCKDDNNTNNNTSKYISSEIIRGPGTWDGYLSFRRGHPFGLTAHTVHDSFGAVISIFVCLTRR